MIKGQAAYYAQVGAVLNQIDPLTALLADGNTVAWYDFMESVTKDGSNAVSSWGDKSGSNHPLLQATGTNQPLWSATGITFDGTDNFLKTANFTYNQPGTIYLVMNQITWGSYKYIFDGSTKDKFIFSQFTSGPNQIRTYAGSANIASMDLPINTWGIVRIVGNGASSKLQVNASAAATGNPGANNPGGITIAAAGDGTGFYGNIAIKEMIFRKVADSEANETLIYNYLKAKYSL